jgi:DNA-binding NtrC family response regulator
MHNTPAVVVVPLTDSFAGVLEDLAGELQLPVVDWRPIDTGRPPAGAAVVVLAGGREQEALDLLSELPDFRVPVYLVGSAADHRMAVAAVQRGASDYFALPGDLDLLRRALERDAQRARSLVAASCFADAERQAAGFDAIIGRSPALRATLDHAMRVAPHRDVTVLLRGETGTGKDILARAIHYHSPRAPEPFVEINCAAIPHNLLESELFGHEKGAFTGAVATKPGLFELAHGGTLFLDEVGNLPLELQPKLLRALESRTIRRVGGQSERHIDVRVIGATNVDLTTAVARGEFREDLFYRLNVIAVTLPPLRYRDGDIEHLAEHFVSEIATSYGLPIPVLTPDVRALLRAHHWPGNVRELRNAIERGLVLSPTGSLRAETLMVEDEPPPERDSVIPFPADLATLSRAAAHAMLDLTGGNKSEAARRLGISRPRLQRLLYDVMD